MGKTILTPKQHKFLELAEKEPQITKRFYLTGGTVLSEFYLQHRLSEDLDLFSEEEVKPGMVEAFLQKIAPRLRVIKIVKEQYLGLFSYKLFYSPIKYLKIDFNYYPFLRVEKGKNFGNFEVSSIYDIAVNKIHTIAMRTNARDFVDIYFIFNETEYNNLERIRIDSQAKFDWPLEPKNLVSQFVRVKDLCNKDFPKMLKPFVRKKMEEFFLRLAKSLEGEIFTE
ncbi:nucleotidyl transferase AbiEii/AbiGii toxin family protein [Candidatus Gottesmanbacteria bacterium]|nr:nucleotidyl transferase AbiEii/AbiGii toxin family protein [Candidatus Gottesmanbacteria bacterium]